MTKQNVLVSDCTSRIGMVGLAGWKASLLSPAIPETLAALGGHISMPQKMLLKMLETGGGARVSAWVDSMRASSPTRIKSTASLPELEDQRSSWIVSVRLSPDCIFISLMVMVRYFHTCF